MAKTPTDKIKEKVVDAAYDEGVNAFQAWRQKAKNGVLPIGISGVGKTTFLSRFDVCGPELFLDFDRTLSVKVDKMKLRKEFIKQCNGVEYVQKIDVPGELPEQWGVAYFDRNPRVLVIMIDEREPKAHISEIKKFLEYIRVGATNWQKVKTFFAGRGENLSRVIFAVNKVDRFSSGTLEHVGEEYKRLLSEVHSLLNVNIQIFHVSLNSSNDNDFNAVFSAVLDGLVRK